MHHITPDLVQRKAKSQVKVFLKQTYSRRFSKIKFTAGSWSPAKSNKRQYLDINLGRIEPIYGIITKGSPSYNEFVTSYLILHSTDGTTFYVLLGPNNKPKKFRGSVDANTPAKIMFDVPIEAKIIRINPRSWHKGIALNVELIGCGEPLTTVIIFL